MGCLLRPHDNYHIHHIRKGLATADLFYFKKSYLPKNNANDC